MEPRLNTKIV